MLHHHGVAPDPSSCDTISVITPHHMAMAAITHVPRCMLMLLLHMHCVCDRGDRESRTITASTRKQGSIGGLIARIRDVRWPS